MSIVILLPSTKLSFFSAVDLSQDDTPICFWIMSGNANKGPISSY